jgi:hypothetical protein
LKELRDSICTLILWCFCVTASAAQSDSLPYRIFKQKIILYSDLGYASAPFSIFYPFEAGIKRIKYRNNFQTVLGFGGSYKWFSLRLAFSLPGSMRPEKKYGNTEQLNLGTDFTIRNLYFDVDLRRYQGYAIENAYLWNNSLSAAEPNDIREEIVAGSFSIHSWYFRNKDFKIQALKGRVGNYHKEVHTWYIKNGLNIFGIGSDSSSVIPIQLHAPNDSKTSSKGYTAIDLGFIPGYAYVNRIKNWQFSGLIGLGAVVQFNFHEVNGQLRDGLWLAPRYDIKIIGGYNVDKYFVMLITDFDNKSIKINNLKYRQAFYSIRLAGGVRFDKKGKKK